MSCAGTYNFCFKKGFTLNLAWKDSLGVLVNTSGYTAKLTVRNLPTSTTRFALELTTTNSKITLGGLTHNVIAKAPASDTLAMPPGNYAYDLELIAGTGEITPLLTGIVTKEPSAVVP
jgi:hypothetical protein